MRHFVVFHNPELQGELMEPGGEPFSIWTRKSVDRVIGNKVWLLTRDAATGSYYIASTFIATDQEIRGGRHKYNVALGSEGQVLGRKARIDQASWWKRLLAVTGSFRWGLTEIKDVKIFRAFERLSRNETPPARRRPQVMKGAGLGKPQSNREVERFAIARAKKYLRKQGWFVKSVEQEARGYDLFCTKASEEIHVEVKGVSGTTMAFIITSNEKEAAKADPLFYLLVVTSARSTKKVHLMTGKDALRRFDFSPLSYSAREND